MRPMTGNARVVILPSGLHFICCHSWFDFEAGSCNVPEKSLVYYELLSQPLVGLCLMFTSDIKF